ncbi:MAG: SMC-Scp complex subunit ScpB [Candidatus Jorgensenbacteria bacterium]|nr:SMC-Scp complex subunit ScpB [Candidatus Jorgensenbacteria bacterium]
MSASNNAKLEALLFYYGEPIAIERAAKLLGIKEDECKTLAHELGEALKNDLNRGLLLIINGDEIQLATKPEVQEVGKKIITEEFKEELSPASLETLSLIAYLGPITRPSIDFIRGVNSSFTVRNLLIRGLVERQSGKGHAYLYHASSNFLSHLGITAPEELPEREGYQKIFTEFEEAQKKQNMAEQIEPVKKDKEENL